MGFEQSEYKSKCSGSLGLEGDGRGSYATSGERPSELQKASLEISPSCVFLDPIFQILLSEYVGNAKNAHLSGVVLREKIW